MIQRIQTLYLLGASILMGLLFFIPLATFMYGGEIFKLYGLGVKSTDINSELVVNTIYMTILLVATTLLPFVTIFFYKRRLIQIRLCMVEIVLLVGMQLYVALYLYRAYNVLGTTSSLVFSVTDIFPLVTILIVYLALRGIIKDEALVKSLNRIR